MNTVSNTSPLIALSKIGHLFILERLFEKILIPKSVSEEFFRNCTDDEKDLFLQACRKFFEIIEVRTPLKFSRRLDPGERDVLTLAIEKKADIVIIDDRKGYNEAKEQHLFPISTRALLKIAEDIKIINDYRILESNLRKKRFFLTKY